MMLAPLRRPFISRRAVAAGLACFVVGVFVAAVIDLVRGAL